MAMSFRFLTDEKEAIAQIPRAKICIYLENVAGFGEIPRY
jgi:hypothetical protein